MPPFPGDFCLFIDLLWEIINIRHVCVLRHWHVKDLINAVCFCYVIKEFVFAVLLRLLADLFCVDPENVSEP